MIIEDVIIGIGNFANTLISIITGSLPPAAVEGIIALFAISLICRIFQGGVRVPKLRKKREDDDEGEWEYIRVTRRK